MGTKMRNHFTQDREKANRERINQMIKEESDRRMFTISQRDIEMAMIAHGGDDFFREVKLEMWDRKRPMAFRFRKDLPANKIIQARGNAFRSLLDGYGGMSDDGAFGLVQNAQRGDTFANIPRIIISCIKQHPHRGERRI